jgi:hypothetical protein
VYPGTDDVDGDKSDDDELPSLQKLLSPAMQGLLKDPFKRVPPWSFLQPTPTQILMPTNRVKVNDDTTHNPGTPALTRSKEPAVLPHMVSRRCVSSSSVEREPVDGSVGGGRHTGRGNSQGRLMTLDSALAER